LAQLNGLYIPGDGRTTLLDKEFMQTTNFLLKWAQDHNKEEGSHFPVVATSYGFLSMLRGQMRSDDELIPMKEEQVCKPLSQNLNLMPNQTFTYDEIEVKTLEKNLDSLKFYNEMELGVPLENFTNSKGLKPFVPVATFHRNSEVHRLDETVSMVEGTVLPFFGFAYRLDKVQFGHSKSDGVDRSAQSIDHAQHVANLIVDESRLSGNKYEYTNKEAQRLLTNNDVVRMELPADHTCAKGKVMTEMYLF